MENVVLKLMVTRGVISFSFVFDIINFLAVWVSTSAGDETAVEGKFLSVAGTLRSKMYYRYLISLIFVTQCESMNANFYITKIIQLQLYLKHRLRDHQFLCWKLDRHLLFFLCQISVA
jgi:hypothetical protein